MKQLDYQETTMERFTAYVEALAANRGTAEKAGAALRAAGIEVPPVDWCKQTWDALKDQGVLPQAADAQGQPFTPPWLSRVDGTGSQVPSVCLKLPTGAGKTYLATRCVEQLARLFTVAPRGSCCGSCRATRSIRKRGRPLPIASILTA